MKIHLRKLTPNAIDHEMIWGGIGLLVLLTARFFPFSLLPKFSCPFHILTGYPCPSCGMTRSFILMGHLKFLEGLKINPLGASLFIFIATFVGYAFIAIIFRLRRIRLQVTEKREGIFIRIAFILVIIINWIFLIIA
ncbi:TPA: DUF2752 domain-containing protein [Candidatus Poribacteria bacterium]|nr:DUF2752 domain-containing protein [Candidatus Poribacteria bacterium]